MRNILAVNLVGALLTLTSVAHSQSPPSNRPDVLDLVLSGGFGPSTLRLSELPAGSGAFDLTLNGFAGIRDLEMGSSRFGELLRGVSSAERHHLMEYFTCYWMTGKSVQLYGIEYAISYKATFPERPIEPTTGISGTTAVPRQKNPLADLTLKLNLVNVSQIISISPLPNLSKADYASAVMRINAPNVAYGGDREVAISNMKQLALGAIMYSADNDDIYVFAQSVGQAKKKIMPYVKSDAIFISQNPIGGQVLYNVNLAGVWEPDIKNPAKVPLFYDSRAWPDGGRPVAFNDGHARYVTAAEWGAVAAELDRKYKRAPKAAPAKTGAKPNPKK